MEPLFQQLTQPSLQREDTDSQEVKAGHEYSSVLGSEGTHELILGTGTIFEQQGQEPVSPPSSPTRATVDLEDGTVAGSLKSPEDQTSSDSESSRENVDDSHLDTASGDCISCSGTGEVFIRTYHKK